VSETAETAVTTYEVWSEAPIKPTYDDWFWICKTSKDDEGEESCMENDVLAYLMLRGEIYVTQAQVGGFPEGDGRNGLQVVSLMLGCNDMFAWACADAEPFSMADVPDIGKAYLADNKWGTLKWIMKKRNQQPQPPVIAMMKRDGAWDEFCDSVGANTQDAETKAAFAMAAAQMREVKL